MQKQLNIHRSSNHRQLAAVSGIIRRKPVRRNGPARTNIAQVSRHGIFSLKLNPIPALKLSSFLNNHWNWNFSAKNIFKDLYPAYLRFMDLSGVSPKVVVGNDFGVNIMYNHLLEVLGQKHDLNLFYDTEKKRHCFNYVTPLPGGGYEYSVFVYLPVVKALQTKGDRKYTKLYHQCLKTLREIGINRWDDEEDFVLDWLGDQEDWEEREEDPKTFRANERLRNKYLNGEARKAVSRIHKHKPLTEQDIKRISKNFDPNHPVTKFALDIYKLLLTKKCIWNYSEEPDDDVQDYILFDYSFCLYYDFDQFFDMHEQYINDQATGGVQDPRISTTITKDMERIPDWNDDFPQELRHFFQKYSDIATQIENYEPIQTS